MRKYKDDKGVSEPFVRLPWSMMDSAAWKSLSTSATWLYSQMLRRWHSGRFILPFADVRWKMVFAVFDRARQELINRGFIVILERHGLDHKANVYGPSEKWKEISRDIMGDRAVGQIVKRLRRVNGEPQFVSEWEPLPVQSAARASSQKANWAKARAAQKGVPTSDRQTSSRRTSPEKKLPGGLEKHSYRIHQLVNDDTPLIVHQLVNDKAPHRSPTGKRPIHQVVNDNATSTGKAPAPKRPGRPKVIKPAPAPQGLPGPSYAVIMAVQREIRAGKGEAELRELVKAQGFDPEKVEWKILQRGVS
jgi:hypothetical protein